MLRHRDLPIASTAHQKVVNETYKIDASKHRPFPNSNPSQLLHQSFPISQNRTSSNSEIPPQINHHHYTSSGSQPDKRPAELGVGSNVRQRQGHLMEVANLKLAFVQTKVPASITSNKQLRNTTRCVTSL